MAAFSWSWMTRLGYSFIFSGISKSRRKPNTFLEKTTKSDKILSQTFRKAVRNYIEDGGCPCMFHFNIWKPEMVTSPTTQRQLSSYRCIDTVFLLDLCPGIIISQTNSFVADESFNYHNMHNNLKYHICSYRAC